jgi:hypothetical protein
MMRHAQAACAALRSSSALPGVRLCDAIGTRRPARRLHRRTGGVSMRALPRCADASRRARVGLTPPLTHPPLAASLVSPAVRGFGQDLRTRSPTSDRLAAADPGRNLQNSHGRHEAAWERYHCRYPLSPWPGLVPAIHAFDAAGFRSWLPGTRACPGPDPRPGMTGQNHRHYRRELAGGSTWQACMVSSKGHRA